MNKHVSHEKAIYGKEVQSRVCQTTKGCSSYKLQDQSCVLIDASQLNFSPENEEELQLHVDISFAPS
eukprot:TCALIF_08393-PA protein Name:"Protein of unknown function" AED:0.24 eAED:0.24 QI:0/0/0/0.5/0/0/2/0/66